jgi:hypothetical protein
MVNMKKIIFIFVFFYATILNAQSFLGIPIDGTQETIKSKLIAKGFKLIKSNQNSYYYKGKLNNENISIMVGATPKTRKVYSFYITYEEIIDSWNSLQSDFNKRNEIIVNKYGEPLKEKREYEYPFKEGDDYTLLALESGKLDYFNVWGSVGENNNLSILLAITKEKNIALLYTNIRNRDIAEKEQSVIDNDAY